MKGKIIKGIAGFYYVYADSCTYECKAKGIFRKLGVKPLVGDDVEFTVIDESDMISPIFLVCMSSISQLWGESG